MSNDTKVPPVQAATEPHAPQDDSVLQSASRFEKYAATQAAADGIQGDVKKKSKSAEEKLGAQMTDMK